VPNTPCSLPADLRALDVKSLPVLSIWQPHAGALFQPLRDWQKTIEISLAPWPAPSWAVVHAPERIDTVALARFGLTAADAEPRGVLLGLVWIAECRPLTPDDEPAAGFYKPDRFALVVRRPLLFERPITYRMPTSRRVGTVDRSIVLGALGGGP
jgi:hypothetical protein